MQADFHYYATYCAASLAGYSPEESYEICYSAQLADWFTKTLLAGIGGPVEAATTQLQAEIVESRSDIVGRQATTRTWASFHFLPRDLYAPVSKGNKRYKDKYRLICGPNGTLVADTVELAKGGTTQAVGVAMHVLADTWAHMYFAGTPSLVINNTSGGMVEIVHEGDKVTERPIRFMHNPSAPDDFNAGVYVNTPFHPSENIFLNLGHGRAGHLPDLSFARYRYMPAWGDYEEVTKDNPSDYWHAFCQMVYAMRYLRGDVSAFELETYDTQAVAPWEREIKDILEVRRLEAGSCEAWRELGTRIVGQGLEAFDKSTYVDEYKGAPAGGKGDTFLGRYAQASLAHKSMVTSRIIQSGNTLAGRSLANNAGRHGLGGGAQAQEPHSGGQDGCGGDGHE